MPMWPSSACVRANGILALRGSADPGHDVRPGVFDLHCRASIGRKCYAELDESCGKRLTKNATAFSTNHVLAICQGDARKPGPTIYPVGEMVLNRSTYE